MRGFYLGASLSNLSSSSPFSLFLSFCLFIVLFMLFKFIYCFIYVLLVHLCSIYAF
jgi:hypothetical protein